MPGTEEGHYGPICMSAMSRHWCSVVTCSPWWDSPRHKFGFSSAQAVPREASGLNTGSIPSHKLEEPTSLKGEYVIVWMGPYQTRQIQGQRKVK